MKVYTCTNFDGHYPVGTAAVVTAFTAEQAADFLTVKLETLGLPQTRPLEMKELEMSFVAVTILCDGNY